MVDRSEQMVRKLINDGKLKSRQEQGRHMVDPNEVVAIYQHQAASRRGAVTRIEAGSQAPNATGSETVALLERQIAMLERELDHTKQLLSGEREARNRIDSEMSSVLKEIRAFMDGNHTNLLTRFFRK